MAGARRRKKAGVGRDAGGGRQQPRTSSGLDDALGVVVAAVALVAGAGVAAGRQLRRRTAGRTGDPASVDRPGAARRPATGVKARLRALGDRFAPLGRALDVQERYGDLHGNNLAAAVTFQAFVSLLPLLLVVVAVVGFLAGNGADVAGRVIGELGLDGDAARAVSDAVSTAQTSRKAASVIGLVSLLWSGLGLVDALQYGYDQVWQVEERGLKGKAVGVLWLLGAVVLFLAAAALTTMLRWLPGVAAPVGVLVALGVNFGLWMWTSKILPNTRLPWRAVVPGAILAAIGLEVLKAGGAILVPRMVSSSSQLYGALGVVFALLAWLFFFGRLIIYSAVLDVVLWERRAGTVDVVTEVPAQPGATPGERVSRMGRLEDARAR